ncbi:MAG: helix-turn-helix transcriptional regulator [Oscillospiraceae bacterium]|nr:helix-turn-helix transcriptional regulator [Oscillospiraceae bacterium]
MPFGEKLRELRGNLSQKELANRLGITKSSLAMYERNERIPRDEVKVRIAKYFGLTVQEIFFGNSEYI